MVWSKLNQIVFFLVVLVSNACNSMSGLSLGNKKKVAKCVGTYNYACSVYYTCTFLFVIEPKKRSSKVGHNIFSSNICYKIKLSNRPPECEQIMCLFG